MHSFLRCTLVCVTLLVVFAAVVPANAIIHFYATGVAAGSPITPECAEAGHVLQHYLQEFPHPPQWSYIIVCDDKAWADVMERDGMDDIGKDVFGTTSLKYATTFLRGPSLTGKGDTRIAAEKIIAHELAHIFLNTLKERPVEKLTDQWLDEYRRRHPGIVIPVTTKLPFYKSIGHPSGVVV